LCSYEAYYILYSLDVLTYVGQCWYYSTIHLNFHFAKYDSLNDRVFSRHVSTPQCAFIVLPGTHYSWLAEGKRDEKLAQGFSHDPLGNFTPDLSLSGPTRSPLGHERALIYLKLILIRKGHGCNMN
jgi:hypothetical protein